MKTWGTINVQHSSHNGRWTADSRAGREGRIEDRGSRILHGVNRGSAVLIVLAILAIITIFIVASTRVVYQLKDELRLTEKRQLQHWASVATNLPPATLTNAITPQP